MSIDILSYYKAIRRNEIARKNTELYNRSRTKRGDRKGKALKKGFKAFLETRIRTEVCFRLYSFTENISENA